MTRKRQDRNTLHNMHFQCLGLI